MSKFIIFDPLCVPARHVALIHKHCKLILLDAILNCCKIAIFDDCFKNASVKGLMNLMHYTSIEIMTEFLKILWLFTVAVDPYHFL